jgi:hypothetical protein
MDDVGIKFNESHPFLLNMTIMIFLQVVYRGEIRETDRLDALVGDSNFLYKFPSVSRLPLSVTLKRQNPTDDSNKTNLLRKNDTPEIEEMPGSALLPQHMER